MQETVHGAVGDLRGQCALVVDAAGHDQHQLRELHVQPRGQLRHRRGERGAVEHRDAGMEGHERGGQIDLGAGGVYFVRRLADLLQRGEQARVLHQCDQRLAGEGKPPGGGGLRLSRFRFMHWDVGHECHIKARPSSRKGSAAG